MSRKMIEHDFGISLPPPTPPVNQALNGPRGPIQCMELGRKLALQLFVGYYGLPDTF